MSVVEWMVDNQGALIACYPSNASLLGRCKSASVPVRLGGEAMADDRLRQRKEAVVLARVARKVKEL